VITQVVPPYYLTDLKTVALYRRSLLKYIPSSKPNFVSPEGFVEAMVIMEELKKAGKEPTREGLIREIESVHDFDIGLGTELKLDYSAKDHKGIRARNSNGDSRWPSGAVRGLVGRCTALKPDKTEMSADRGFCLIEGVVGRADQRAGLHVLEAHLFAQPLELGELVRVNEPDDREMIARRLQVLAESKNVCALRGEIPHGGKNFVFLFTETEHHPCFRRDVGMSLFGSAK
jgi:Periplasmic binding protein